MRPDATSTSRVESIDLVRGIVMIVMALDHVRDYVHRDSLVFSPTDLARTTPALFATRFITHLCAPTFILLAGTSAHFIARRKTLAETSAFLVTRGLWLVVLQLTVICFAWNFDPAFHYNASSILSTIGLCMIALAALIHLPFAAILGVGLVMVIGHNALDGISFENGTAADVVWSLVHAHKTYALGHGYTFLFLYPLVPWVGVMALGYCLGRLYDEGRPSAERRETLLQLGMLSLITFVGLRWANVYGDPVPWTARHDTSATLMSFFSLEKYPPSLLYLCATLGVALVLLGVFEGRDLARWRPVTLFGRVALFYYVLHIFVAHVVALAAVTVAGYPWRTMVFLAGSHNDASPLLKGKWGFGLGGLYLTWAVVVAGVYPLCRRWNEFRKRNRSRWWVSYV